MNNEIKNTEQSNYYKVFDSMGRPTSIYYLASNINEAIQMFKEDTANYSKYYYGKLKRVYRGGQKG